MYDQSHEEHTEGPGRTRTFTENLEVTGNQLVDRVKDLIKEGNVRRLIVRTPDGSVNVDIPLTVGVAAGGVLTLASLPLALLGVLAALVARAQIQVVREEPAPPTELNQSPKP